jgi:threonine dehydrogenase-like Zn-dependent dehydrogenase
MGAPPDDGLGRDIVVCGQAAPRRVRRSPLPMARVAAQELEVYGSHGMAARDYPAMLALVADGTLRPDRLVGEVIGIDAAGEASRP